MDCVNLLFEVLSESNRKCDSFRARRRYRMRKLLLKAVCLRSQHKMKQNPNIILNFVNDYMIAVAY